MPRHGRPESCRCCCVPPDGTAAPPRGTAPRCAAAAGGSLLPPPGRARVAFQRRARRSSAASEPCGTRASCRWLPPQTTPAPTAVAPEPRHARASWRLLTHGPCARQPRKPAPPPAVVEARREWRHGIGWKLHNCHRGCRVSRAAHPPACHGWSCTAEHAPILHQAHLAWVPDSYPIRQH